jgi:hypothetical protein
MSDSEADDDDDGSQHRPLSKKARSSTASSVAVNLSDNDESDGVRKPIRTTATTVTKQRLTKSTRAMIDSDDGERPWKSSSPYFLLEDNRVTLSFLRRGSTD